MLPPYFDRSWLLEQYYETQRLIEDEGQVFVTEDKVELVTGPTQENIYVYLNDYIQWLYNQYDKMKR